MPGPRDSTPVPASSSLHVDCEDWAIFGHALEFLTLNKPCAILATMVASKYQVKYLSSLPLNLINDGLGDSNPVAATLTLY